MLTNPSLESVFPDEIEQVFTIRMIVFKPVATNHECRIRALRAQKGFKCTIPPQDCLCCNKQSVCCNNPKAYIETGRRCCAVDSWGKWLKTGSILLISPLLPPLIFATAAVDGPLLPLIV